MTRTDRFSRAWRIGMPVLATLICPLLLSSAIGAVGGEFLPAPAATPPELRLPDLDGRERNLDQFAGQVILVNYWASWCKPCIDEMPSIQRLAKQMDGRQFAVVGVNVAESTLKVRSMVKRLRIDFPVLLDRDSAVFRAWNAGVLPTSYLLDGNGVVRYLARGPREWDSDEIIGLIGDLLDADSDSAVTGTTRLEQR
ncbi:MAG: TlpA disulfide reductase family protein [Thiohalocapsa sp.]